MTSSSSKFTYWSLLGLNPGSNSEELKKAFKREAMHWHPDLNRNDRNAEERFKWINKAYKVLSDPRSKFEWEVAGRPTFEINISEDQTTSEPSSVPCNEEEVLQKSKPISFSASEKVVLMLISIFSLFILNSL